MKYSLEDFIEYRIDRADESIKEAELLASLKKSKYFKRNYNELFSIKLKAGCHLF